jgi:hypothetical protein
VLQPCWVDDMIAQLWRFSLIALWFSQSGCVTGNSGAEASVNQYSGDGVVHLCSTMFTRGYAIDFPTFSSAKPYQATYRLSNLPSGRELALVLLRFSEPGLRYGVAQKEKNSVTSTFGFTLLSAKGHTLHSAAFQLSSAVWTEHQGVFGIYELGKSQFHFEPHAAYVLNVFYRPGADPPPAKRLYFAIDNCGFY